MFSYSKSNQRLLLLNGFVSHLLATTEEGSNHLKRFCLPVWNRKRNRMRFEFERKLPAIVTVVLCAILYCIALVLEGIIQ